MRRDAVQSGHLFTIFLGGGGTFCFHLPFFIPHFSTPTMET
jgi:hypothetical protein